MRLDPEAFEGRCTLAWKAERIDASRHGVFKAVHPSPLSASRGFFGSRPFSQANAWLQAHGREGIDWALPAPQGGLF